MKNIKLSVKLIGGFVTTAIITLVVGLVGYVQLTRMVEHVDMIAQEDMQKVESLLQMESHLNALMIGVRTLMSPVIDQETRQAQYQTITRNRELYQEQFKRYSAISHSVRETKLGKDFLNEVGTWAQTGLQRLTATITRPAHKPSGLCYRILYSK